MVILFLRPRTEFDAPECTYVFSYIVLKILAYFCGLQYVVVDHQHILTGQTDTIFTLLRDGEKVVANFLTFLRPEGTKLHLLFRLTTNQQDRKFLCLKKCDVSQRLAGYLLTSLPHAACNDTMMRALWSHIILQKSFMVPGKGFWVMMNSRLCQ